MRAMLMPMALTPKMILIVVIGVFLASFTDGVAGGGGIISVPTYFLAGLPAHLALGTNKLSSSIGTAVSAARFIRGGYVDWKLALPSIALKNCRRRRAISRRGTARRSSGRLPLSSAPTTASTAPGRGPF